MDYDVVGIVWPDPENYDRFREVCGEDYPPTFLEFLQQVGPRLVAVQAFEKRVEKVVVDADEMQAWCLRHHGKVDTEARALFAMFKLRSKYGKGSDAIN